MCERYPGQDTPIARIAARQDDRERPFWSVMIPIYNRTTTLEAALRCVLDQDPGAEHMQIAVVDDCSANGAGREIVERVAPSRIEFYRQPSRVGIGANWNACLSRSRGYCVHILHDDDLVLPGFYERMRHVMESEPSLGAAFCRNFFMDADGHWQSISELEQKTPGILDRWLERIAVRQRIQCPAIVVKRSVYEEMGGFHTDLRYSLDWEMWTRIATRYAVWYEPEPLASFRVHNGNESWRLHQSGKNVTDRYKAIDIMSAYLPVPLRKNLKHEARRFCTSKTLEDARQMLIAGQRVAAMRQIRQVAKHVPSLWFSRRLWRMYRWAWGLSWRQCLSFN